MPDNFSSDPAKHVEGKLWQISYTLKEGGKKAGPLQIARNYTDLIVKQGGKKLWEQVSINGGTTIAQLPVAGHSLWLQLDINNDGEQFILTVVEEAAMEQIVEFTASQLATELRNKGSVSLHNILFDIGKATIKTESGAAI